MNELEKLFNGVSAEFFRHALNYIDFPPEDLEPDKESGEERSDSSSRSLAPPVAGVPTSFPSEFSGGGLGNNASERKPFIPVNLPAGVSAIENFFSRNIPLQNRFANATESGRFLTGHLPADPGDSPPGFLPVTSSRDVCALESESRISQMPAKKKMKIQRELNSPSVTAVTKQCQGVKTCHHCGAVRPTGPKTLCNACGMRYRSGRLAPMHCARAHSTESSKGCKSMDVSALGSESHISKMLVKKKPKRQMELNSPSVMKPSQAVKTCLHCGAAKTPQWRNGPMGPKTLCNACGMRYKSGGLTSEYRPIASPMFDPSLHSNLRSKVKGLQKMLELQNNLEIDQTQPPPLGPLP